MQHPGFFERRGPFTVGELARQLGGEADGLTDPTALVRDVRPLDMAGPGDLTFIDNRKYIEALATTRADFCLVAPALAARVPKSTQPIILRSPYHGFAAALEIFYPDASMSKAANFAATVDGVLVHPSARIEAGAIIEPGAVVGREASVGAGTTIAACAVVGYRVTIGRGGYVGPGASVTHALVGDRVVIHAGARIGQDGFGFALGPQGHRKVPQIGRVVIQDDVEIGAGTTIDRGSLKDTIIGEGSKIDNLVQIGHNAVLGRNCVIVGQVGISGSAELGDFVIMGGHSGVVGHTKIGAGSQIAGMAHVKDDVPPGARMGGTPARPFREWAREIAAIRRIARPGGGEKDDRGAGD
ncbi:MAG: UDP-3-O-(3-hydroxymyristoyl)glucosamine N-acyltransferase [Hyphomicrobiaceae bacterium]